MNVQHEYAEKAWRIFLDSWPDFEGHGIIELMVKELAVQRFTLLDLAKVCTCDRPPYLDEHGTCHGVEPHTAECVRTRVLLVLGKDPD